MAHEVQPWQVEIGNACDIGRLFQYNISVFIVVNEVDLVSNVSDMTLWSMLPKATHRHTENIPAL